MSKFDNQSSSLEFSETDFETMAELTEEKGSRRSSASSVDFADVLLQGHPRIPCKNDEEVYSTLNDVILHASRALQCKTTGFMEDTQTSNIEQDPSTITASRTTEAIQWLKNNYERAEQTTTIARCDLYDHYLQCSEASNIDALCQATFGKLVRLVFPGLKARRLGTRGKSRYHYCGIRVTVPIHMKILVAKQAAEQLQKLQEELEKEQQLQILKQKGLKTESTAASFAEVNEAIRSALDASFGVRDRNEEYFSPSPDNQPSTPPATTTTTTIKQESSEHVDVLDSHRQQMIHQKIVQHKQQQKQIQQQQQFQQPPQQMPMQQQQTPQMQQQPQQQQMQQQQLQQQMQPQQFFLEQNVVGIKTQPEDYDYNFHDGISSPDYSPYSSDYIYGIPNSPPLTPQSSVPCTFSPTMSYSMVDPYFENPTTSAFDSNMFNISLLTR